MDAVVSRAKSGEFQGGRGPLVVGTENVARKSAVGCAVESDLGGHVRRRSLVCGEGPGRPTVGEAPWLVRGRHRDRPETEMVNRAVGV